jgi:nucleoid DNA-binding protein
MNRREFVRRVTDELRAAGIKKPIRTQKHVLHISDDEGHHKDFVVKGINGNYVYTIDDVEAILDMCKEVIQDNMRQGEPLTITGIGTLGITYRTPRRIHNVRTGKLVETEGRFIPKFTYAKDLGMCARTYGKLLEEDIKGLEMYINDAEYEGCDDEE